LDTTASRIPVLASGAEIPAPAMPASESVIASTSVRPEATAVA
jgi:hypothetical protein